MEISPSYSKFLLISRLIENIIIGHFSDNQYLASRIND